MNQYIRHGGDNMRDVISETMGKLAIVLTERQSGYVEGVLQAIVRPELDALQQMCGDLEQQCDKLTIALSDANRSIEILTAPAQPAMIEMDTIHRFRGEYSADEIAELRKLIVSNIRAMNRAGKRISQRRYDVQYPQRPPVRVFCQRMGVSWNDLMREAGVIPNLSGRHYAAMKAGRSA